MTKTIEEAKERGYIDDATRKGVPWFNEFYYYCEKEGKPFVKVVNSRKYFTVTIDLPYRVKPPYAEQWTGLARTLFAMFGAQKGACAGAGSQYPFVSGIPLEHKELAMKAIMDWVERVPENAERSLGILGWSEPIPF